MKRTNKKDKSAIITMGDAHFFIQRASGKGRRYGFSRISLASIYRMFALEDKCKQIPNSQIFFWK